MKPSYTVYAWPDGTWEYPDTSGENTAYNHDEYTVVEVPDGADATEYISTFDWRGEDGK